MMPEPKTLKEWKSSGEYPPEGTPILCGLSEFGLCNETFPFNPAMHNRAYCCPQHKRKRETIAKRQRRLVFYDAGNSSAATILSDIPEQDILQELSRRGRKVRILEEAITDRHVKINTRRLHGDTIRIGAISCTHLGSLYQQLTALREFYRYCAETGVTDIFHAGDMVDGMAVYEGQEYEVFAHGFDAQVKYAIENYPQEEGIATHVISGNHDHSFNKIGGANIIQAISREREDIHYLGDFGAHVEIDGIRIYLMHGRGGHAYARSYKLQKIIENFTPENKPHILLAGHWHTLCILPLYRNVEAFSLGSFQAQTPYLRRMGIWPAVCGLILEITPDDKGLAKIRAEWPMWHIMRTEDY